MTFETSQIEVKPGQTIVFIGDSITDAGRNDPAYQPLGYGYVHFVCNLLLAKYPELNLNLINTGIGGNTIRDLKGRWEKDCINHRPDILSVLIGINDLWRQHCEPPRLTEAVFVEEFQQTYEQLLSVAREKCRCQLILMAPFMFCNDSRNQMFIELQAYIKVVRSLAEKFDEILVPLQKRIDEKIIQVAPEKWSADSVHPYLWAHAWIAKRWLQAANL